MSMVFGEHPAFPRTAEAKRLKAAELDDLAETYRRQGRAILAKGYHRRAARLRDEATRQEQACG